MSVAWAMGLAGRPTRPVCPSCGGSGFRTVAYRNGGRVIHNLEVDGRGVCTTLEDCGRCNGTGQTPADT